MHWSFAQTMAQGTLLFSEDTFTATIVGASSTHFKAALHEIVENVFPVFELIARRTFSRVALRKSQSL